LTLFFFPTQDLIRLNYLHKKVSRMSRDSNMMYNEPLWVSFITKQITMWTYHQIHQLHLTSFHSLIMVPNSCLNIHFFNTSEHFLFQKMFISVSWNVFGSAYHQSYCWKCTSSIILLENPLLQTCLSMHIIKYALYRMAKTHRIPYLYRSFPAKVTYI